MFVSYGSSFPPSCFIGVCGLVLRCSNGVKNSCTKMCLWFVAIHREPRRSGSPALRLVLGQACPPGRQNEKRRVGRPSMKESEGHPPTKGHHRVLLDNSSTVFSRDPSEVSRFLSFWRRSAAEPYPRIAVCASQLEDLLRIAANAPSQVR